MSRQNITIGTKTRSCDQSTYMARARLASHVHLITDALKLNRPGKREELEARLAKALADLAEHDRQHPEAPAKPLQPRYSLCTASLDTLEQLDCARRKSSWK